MIALCVVAPAAITPLCKQITEPPQPEDRTSRIVLCFGFSLPPLLLRKSAFGKEMNVLVDRELLRPVLGKSLGLI